MIKKIILKLFIALLTAIAIVLAVAESDSTVMFLLSKIAALVILTAVVKVAIFLEKCGIIKIDEE